MSSIAELEAANAEQGAKVAALKKEKADKATVDAAVALLLGGKDKLKVALEEALAAATSAGDQARVAELQEKIEATKPRPNTKKQAKEPKEPKAAAAPPPRKEAAPKKEAAASAPAKEAARAATAPAAPVKAVGAATAGLSALVDLAALDKHLETRSYVEGATPSQADVSVLKAAVAPTAAHPNALRWYKSMFSLSDYKLSVLPGKFEALAPAPAAAAGAATAGGKPADGLWAPGFCIPCMPGGMAAFTKPDEVVCRGPHPKWRAPSVAQGQRVTGLRVHNSLTSELELFVPKEGNKVKWYTCGPTVYDACHMGHARAYLTMDILRRVMEDYFGYEVFMQVNVTDVDDKIIARARKNKLVADYTKEKGDAGATGAVQAYVREAAAAFDAKMQKKLAKLEVPLTDRREEDERVTLLEQHRQKLAAWGESLKKIEAACGAADASVGAMCAAAAEPLAEALDATLGAAVTQHEIFNAHARRYEAEFVEDLESLHIRMPDALSRVTEYVDDIVAYVKQIVDKGFAYESNGSVYMDIGKFRGAEFDYPKLEPSKGKATAAEMEESEGAHTAGAGEKRNAADFALWKKSKGGEPSWESPWGGGRPGWHIECSVMASDVIGDSMDVHAGGSDLKFPHHDNEIAQAEAYHGCQQWVNYFFHFGHLHIKGLKMSKSLKNFVTIRQALENHSARRIRLMFLLQPWDKPMNYSDQTIEEAEKRETSFKSFFATVKEQLRKQWLGRSVRWDARARQLSDSLTQRMARVHECLCDNFDTPGAMAELLGIVSDTNKYVSEAAGKDDVQVDALLLKKGAMYVTKILRIFGVVTLEDFGFPVSGDGAGGGNREEVIAPVVDELVSFRDTVRSAAKGVPELMKACDELRDSKLTELGVRVEDRNEGARWTLDDPATLRKEQREKLAAAAESKVAKLANKLSERAKDLDKVKTNLVPADQLLRSPPHAAKYDAASFNEAGKPSRDASGAELSKAEAKNLDKLLTKHAGAHDKQKAALAKTPALMSDLEAQVATLKKDAAAVMADAATMAVLSEELVAQLKELLA